MTPSSYTSTPSTTASISPGSVMCSSACVSLNVAVSTLTPSTGGGSDFAVSCCGAAPASLQALIAARLDALSPLRVLERGYSITFGPDGKVVESVAGLTPGDALFEAVSGITTTGLSTIEHIADRSPALWFARAWMQWYGGLGIVVLSVGLLMGHQSAARRLVEPFSPETLASTARTFARRMLEEASVSMVAGTDFGAVAEDHVRISYANSRANLRLAIDAFTVSARVDTATFFG